MDEVERKSATEEDGSGEPHRSLDTRLATEVDQLVRAAVLHGDVDADDLSRAERLQRVSVLAREAGLTRSFLQIFVTFVVLTVALSAVLLLLLVRLPAATVSLEAAVTSVSLRAAEQQRLNAPLLVSVFTVGPVREVWVGDDRLQTQPGATVSIRTEPETSAGAVVPSLLLGAGDTVVARAGEGGLELTVDPPMTPLTLSGRGAARLYVTPRFSDTIDLGGLAPVSVVCCAGAAMKLSIVPVSDAVTELADILEVDSLSFADWQDHTEQARRSLRRRSGILEGEFHFVSLPGKSVSLRSGEHLRFDRADGEVTLRLVGDRLDVRFFGTVRNMRAGAHDESRSLMPTLLEWLQAQHSIWLLFGVASYLITTAWALVHLWRRQ